MTKSEESGAQALLSVNLDHLLLPELDYLMIEMIETAQSLYPREGASRAEQENRTRLQELLLEKMKLTAQCVHRARQAQQELERASQRGLLSDWSKLSG